MCRSDQPEVTLREMADALEWALALALLVLIFQAWNERWRGALYAHRPDR